MVFCSLTDKQHEQLYKIVYKAVSDKLFMTDNALSIPDLSTYVYNLVMKKSNNKDLALTFVSFVPRYLNSIQAIDDDLRKIIKSKIGEVVDYQDVWESDINKVADYLNLTKPEEKGQKKDYQILRDKILEVLSNGNLLQARFKYLSETGTTPYDQERNLIIYRISENLDQFFARDGKIIKTFSLKPDRKIEIISLQEIVNQEKNEEMDMIKSITEQSETEKGIDQMRKDDIKNLENEVKGKTKEDIKKDIKFDC